MLTAIKNNRSLTFYQPTSIKGNINFSSVSTGGISATAISTTVYTTATTTNQFNTQLNNYLAALHAERDRIAQKVANGLAKDPNYKGARADGVKLAWDYEKADVEMGGTGSENWNADEQQEIKESGRVRGAEGHHQKNVANHPEEQGNPDNIKFYRTREEHREKGHDGDFHNETDGPMTDKDNMLKKTNQKRVFRNELRGLKIAAAIGLGVGFTIGFAASLAKSGISPDTVKYALVEGVKTGLSSGVQASIGYGIGRTIGQLATKTIQGVLSNAGIAITENIKMMCNMGAVGAITIAVFSTWQFIRLLVGGTPIKQAAIHVGRQALFSLSLLAVSIAAQGIWGGPAGLIVSISSGIILISYTLVDTVHQRKFSEEIRVYMINKCRPVFD